MVMQMWSLFWHSKSCLASSRPCTSFSILHHCISAVQRGGVCLGFRWCWAGQMYLSRRHKMRLHELHANFYSVAVAVPHYLMPGIIISVSIIIIFPAEIDTENSWFPPCRLFFSFGKWALCQTGLMKQESSGGLSINGRWSHLRMKDEYCMIYYDISYRMWFKQ